MLAEIFVLGSLWFWLLTIVGFIILATVVENEAFGAGIIIAGLYLFLIVGLGDVRLAWIIQHPGYTIGMAAAYIAIGIGWSFIKYYFMLTRLKFEYTREKNVFKPNISKSYGNTYPDWDAYIKSGHCEPAQKINRINKGQYEYDKIVGWMAYWPFSLIATLFSDVLQRFFEHLYITFHGLYASIKQRVLGNIISEINN